MSDLLDTAQAMVEAALTEARAQGARVTVVVLDASFVDVAVARMDGAYASSVAVARAKAHTALNFEAPTDVMKEKVVPENRAALSAVEPRLMFVGGGVPVLRDGAPVAAVGISGGSEAQDVACARAAAEVAG